MASTISLSAGVRSALSSLAQTTSASQQGQYRLATGKKVNSAVDNAVNFFTAAGLNDRAGQFTNLLDGISNGIQTITSASKGIDAITKLVQSAQSTIKQAQADAAQNRPSVTTASLGATKAAALASTVVGAGTLTLTAGSTEFSVTLTATDTIRDAVNKINDSGIATASVNNAGELTIKGSGSDDLVVAGANATLAAGLDGTATATGNSDVRASLVDQFNELRTQIDQLAKDAGYNGINLLSGDALSVVFNEKTGAAQNKLDIQGDEITASNLGIQEAGAAGIDFQDDTDLSNAADALTNALTSLRSTASSLGSSLGVVQARQDFSKDLISTLTQGADNLVLADTNEEGAKLLALQTRQQLSQTALSLSSQADQAVLRLF
ncbi:flagellin N-terminal helical domain-containing protein [Bosea sp. (in: a-proteobacteria)]|jgi:flagellin|uniref:flagellin N-terminal helical domain-containing protein n=1 Tax=Bosea sp. (in: a-proteobacteria) TaxID=1871050 RepID=UPI003F6F771E